MIRFQSYSPEKNAVGVSRTSPIYFEIRNDGTVADKTTLNVTVDGNNVIVNGVFQAGYAGIIDDHTRGYNVYITQNLPFAQGSDIVVTININTEFNDVYSFTIITSDVTAPVTIANPRGSTYASAQDVQLLTNEPATTYYTINGSLPSTSSLVYSAPIPITENTILRFFSEDSDSNTEYIHTEMYVIDIQAVDTNAPITTPNIAGGTYHVLSSIILTADEPSTIYWTINGQTPTVNSYDGKDTSPVTIQLQQGTTVLKFFAVDDHGNEETVKSETYIIDPRENNIVPKNVFVSHPYIKNTVDICWDDMTPIESDIVGYNVYRSQVDGQQLMDLVSHDTLTSEDVYTKEPGTFVKINNQLITVPFYRDQQLDRIVTQEDVSEQFKFKTLADAATDFSGQIVNADYWEAIDPDRLFNQSDGIHFTDVYGGSKEAYFQSKFRMRNDFEIETAYEQIVWPVTDNIRQEEMAFIIAVNQYTCIELSRIRREAYDYYVSRLIVNSQEISKVETQTMDSKGQIKIVRYDSNVSTYYYDGISWVLLESYLSFSRDDLQVRFYAVSADKPIDVLFSYFHINSGNAYLPLLKNVDGQYCIQTQHKPIIGTDDKEYTDSINEVEVIIDGQVALIDRVDGLKGTIILKTEREFDYVLDKWIEPVIPTPESIATVTYKYRLAELKLNLRRFPHYKVTAVLSNGSETRLSWCTSVTLQSEKLDYMYREAIRRNAWLLDQAGERVLLFIKKTTGERCQCYRLNQRTHKQPKVGSCLECWGTGFIGGYVGPFEIKISPFQAEQKITMTDRGMHLDNVEDTWTTITPVITQRDFIVRRNGQIYAIGPAARPEVKGEPTQQHFSVEHVDSTDIRYKFVQSLNLYGYQDRVGLRKGTDHYTENPIITDGEVTEHDRQRTDKGPTVTNVKRGRTITFENTLY